MRARAKWMAVALLLALLACREHPFSKERFLKECDIHPERMLRALELIPADSEIDIYWIRAELRYIRSRSVKPNFTGPYSRMC